MAVLIDARIQQLPQLSIGSKALKIPVYNPGDDITYHIDLDDLLKSSDNSYPWQSDVEYDINDIVVFGGKFWESLQNGNTNNIPAENAFWTEVSKSESTGLSEWAAGVYDQSEVFVVHNRIIYQLTTVAGRPYNSVDIDAEISAGDWVPISSYQFENIVYLDQTQLIGNVYNTHAAAKTAAGNGGLIIVNPGAACNENLAVPGETRNYWFLPGAAQTVTTDSTPLIDDENEVNTKVYIYGNGKFYQNSDVTGPSCILMQNASSYLYIEGDYFYFKNSFSLNCPHEINIKLMESDELSTSWIQGTFATGEGIYTGLLILSSTSFNSALIQNNGAARRIFRRFRLEDMAGGSSAIGVQFVVSGGIVELDDTEFNLNNSSAIGLDVDTGVTANSVIKGLNYFNRVENVVGTINYSGGGFIKAIDVFLYPDFNVGVSDDSYGVGWNGETANAPSQNAMYDKIESMYSDFIRTSNGGSVAAGNINFADTYGITFAGGAYIKANGNNLDFTTPSGELNFIDSSSFSAGLYSNDIDTKATGGTDTLNIGTGNADVINIGRSGATVNILGAVINEYATNAYVTDKLITLNDGGAIASGIGVGFEIEENNVIMGYFKTDAARSGYVMKAPGVNYYAGFDLSSLSADRSLIIPDAAGTIALTSNITASAVGNTTAQWNADKIQGVNVYNGAPTNGQVLVYSSANTRWEPGTISLSGYFTNGGNAFAGNASIGLTDNYTLAFKTNNVTAFTIDTSQNIIVSTSTASTTASTGALQVAGGVGIAGNLNVRNDQDSTIILGRVRIHNANSDELLIAHYDNSTAGNYALRQLSSGLTRVNGGNGQGVNICIGDQNYFTFGTAGITIGTFTLTNNAAAYSLCSIASNYTTTASVAGSMTGISITSTYNQTGTSSQTIRGVYYNPTITAILGTHNAWESTSGNMVLGGNNTVGLYLQNNGSTPALALSSAGANLITIGSGFTNLNIAPGTISRGGSLLFNTTGIEFSATNGPVLISGGFSGSTTGSLDHLRITGTISKTVASVDYTTVRAAPTLSFSSAANNAAQIFWANPTITTTNVTIYGFRSSISASLTGGGQGWNFYADGTAPNWFGGDTMIDSAKGLYFGNSTTDGTWRLVRSGSNLNIDLRESGSYVTKETISSYLNSTLNTTNATPTTIYTVPTSTNKVYLVRYDIVARRTGGAAGSAGDFASVGAWVIVNNIAGTASIEAYDFIAPNESSVGWAANCGVSNDISGTNLNIVVTGVTDYNITWKITNIKITEV